MDNTQDNEQIRSITGDITPLPDIYSGELNTGRIKEYTKIGQCYSITKGTVRDIFCAGADWYKSLLKNSSLENEKLKSLNKELVEALEEMQKDFLETIETFWEETGVTDITGSTNALMQKAKELINKAKQ